MNKQKTSTHLLALFAATATLVLAACSSEEKQNGTIPTNKVSINFSLYSNSYSRANDGGTATTAATLSENGFTTLAIYQADEDTEEEVYFFQNITPKTTNGNTSFQSSYYWPLQGSMKFYAVYPLSGGSEGITLNNSATDIKLGAWTCPGSVDVVAATTATFTCPVSTATLPSFPNIPLSFNHLLANVSFKFVPSDKNPDLTYKIKSFTIKALGNAAGYDFSNEKWDMTGATETTYTFIDEEVSFKGNETYDCPTTLFMLPQSGTRTISISMEIYNKDILIDKRTTEVNLGSTYPWTKGIKTNTNFTLYPQNNIGFTVDVEEW